MKVVLDSNIFISAILFGGKPRQILGLVRKHKIELFISEFIALEVSQILKGKFAQQDKEITKILRKIRKISTTVFPNNKIDIITKKLTDNRILECALEARADFIVSGDKKHILPLKKFRGIKIVTANDFLETLTL